MRRDPTEFRQRFAAWKDGENYWDTRGEDMLPGYSGGKTGFYSTHRDKWKQFLISKGVGAEQADRLSVYFAAQDSLESGGGTSSAARQKNNFGGMQRGGKNISYDTVQDYMNDKWNMMNKRFSRALNAKTVQEYATLINDPKYAGKGYLYAVADGYNQKNPQDRAWVARQIQHMNNYTKAMMGIAGQKGFVARPVPKAPVVSKTEPIQKANPIPSAVELLKQNELPVVLPEPTVTTTQTPTQAAQQAQLSEYIQKPLVSEKVPVLGGDYWENFFNNNSLDQFQSLMQQQMTSHKHGKNILPRHTDGKTPGEYNEELVELPEVRVDDEGNVVQDGRRGSIRLPNVTIKPDHNVREAVDRYYDKMSRRSERAWYTNPITGESYMPKGGPLESVYPEFDLITLGQMSTPILKAAGKKFVQNRSYSLGRPTVPHEFSKPSLNKISIHEEGVIQPKYSDLLKQKSLGTYLDEGGESTVFENIRFPNRVIKEKEGLQSVQNFEELEERIEKDLLQNKLPNTLPLKYEGYTHEPVFRKVKTGKGSILKQHFDIFKPVYSQKRITPANKIADPWHTVRKEGSVWEPSNDWYRQLEYLGYNRTSDGFYKVSGFPYKVGDLGPSNVGFDDFGNMLIFDPLIHYKHGKNPIHINPANRGKFNALKKRTGKTTEQLTHSKNPLTRKRAVFALNSRKWRRK